MAIYIINEQNLIILETDRDNKEEYISRIKQAGIKIEVLEYPNVNKLYKHNPYLSICKLVKQINVFIEKCK